MRRFAWLFFLFLLVAVVCGTGPALAQDTAAVEAAHRHAVLAGLPANAAKRLFGLTTQPAPAPPGGAQAIGSYARGCIAGAVPLPADGLNWQVMRPSRNRAWGHPVMIAFLERLAARLPAAADWPGLLVGDMGQPRGGPMLTGHESHQIGLDVDLWLKPMPSQRLSPAERDTISSIDLVAAGGLDIDHATWLPQHRALLATVSRDPEVARIFVNPAIKRELCREAGTDRAWLTKIRPWWGHKTHFHVRLICPAGNAECRDQPPPPPGDGCGKELDWWFTPEALHPKPGPPGKPLLVSDLPPACAALVEPAAATVR